METCKTCRWWGIRNINGNATVAYEGDSKACCSPKLIDIEEHKEGYAAIKGDGFGLDYPVCDLMTGPDFGCVHHEVKP